MSDTERERVNFKMWAEQDPLSVRIMIKIGDEAPRVWTHWAREVDKPVVPLDLNDTDSDKDIWR